MYLRPNAKQSILFYCTHIACKHFVYGWIFKSQKAKINKNELVCVFKEQALTNMYANAVFITCTHFPPGVRSELR